MTLVLNKESAKNLAKRRGPAPWLDRLAEASGYSRTYLSRAINGHVSGPVNEVIKEARRKGLVPASAGKR